MIRILNYIDGQLSESSSKTWIDNVNPATAEIYSEITSGNEEDVNKAVEAAQKAFPFWSSLKTEDRSNYLLKLASLMERDLEDLALAESIDSGKPLHVARTIDIPRAIANIRFFATAILHSSSEAHASDDLAINYTLRQPFGVAACISPWNLPLYLFTWKIAPALASGNTVVSKPSEITPMTAFLFSKLCIEANFPAGVLNVLHGYGPQVGAALVAHKDISAVSFTGGTQTGAAIARIAAPQFKKLSLELGGKNATLIFADCDFEHTVKEAVRAAFSNQGQICLCGSRILIERSLYPRFRDAFVARVKQLRIGNPMDAQTDMGAVVSEQHMLKVLSYIQLAKEEGGTILSGGERVLLSEENAPGFFIAPTVIEGLNSTARCNQEEIFGPVVTLMPFDGDQEAIDFANSTAYGLAFSVWTSNVTRAHSLAAKLKTGIVWVNCWMLRDLRTPFGGVKQSGVGREGGWEALRFFTEAKNVCVKI
jgi:aminomuconate-semialdehyde/2-hydroxymuconate-6-semialdehyde dehydrogenase